MSYKEFNPAIPQNDFRFLQQHGLKPHHKILDVGCGGGRMGYELINYLHSGNYYGFDKRRLEINRFLTGMRSAPDLATKSAEIHVDNFELRQFDEYTKFDFVYAYSVFTHVAPDLIKTLLKNLKRHISPHSRFYATVLLGSEGFDLGPVHERRKNEYSGVWYTLEFLQSLGDLQGYDVKFVGDEKQTWEGVSRMLGDWKGTERFAPHAPWLDTRRWAPFYTKACKQGKCPATYNGKHTHSGHQEMVMFRLKR
jgi:SAM-dependent methyltransferase